MSSVLNVPPVPVVWSWQSPRSLGFGRFQGDSNSGHVLLFDCTLSLVLHGLHRCTVLATGFVQKSDRISRHFVFFYSKYWMGLKFLNFRCFMSWTVRKINKCMGNQQCNSYMSAFYRWALLFSRIFRDFSIPMIIFKALKISTLNSQTFHTFPGSLWTLLLV